MFGIYREKILSPENDGEKLKTEIIMLLKEHKLSLSQTRAIFHIILDELEDTPLV